MTDPDVCTIRSTVDKDRRAACLIEWGTVTAILDTNTVLATAHDLTAAAAAAQCDAALLNALRGAHARDELIGMLLSQVRLVRQIGVPALPPTRPALRIEAVAGAKTGKPIVRIARGSRKGDLTPSEARAMAHQWTQAAIAAVIDVRLRYALGEWDHLTPDQIEDLFDLIRSVYR